MIFPILSNNVGKINIISRHNNECGVKIYKYQHRKHEWQYSHYCKREKNRYFRIRHKNHYTLEINLLFQKNLDVQADDKSRDHK